MSKRISALCVILFLFCSVRVNGAESNRVNIAADEINYDYDSKQIQAGGNVRIEYRDTKISSDRVIIDQELKALLATGNVQVEQDGDQYYGEQLLYYLKSRQGRLLPSNTTITGDGVEEPIRFSSAEAFLDGELIKTKHSYITGCNLEHPHYHLTAQEIEYYPDDRIILHHVWYWERNIRLLYLPYLYISLDDEEDNFEFNFGHNESEGWFAEIGYTYYVNQSNRLVFESAMTELAGNDYGIVHKVKLADNREWYQEYQINNQSSAGYYDYSLGYGYKDESNKKHPFQIDLLSWRRFDTTGEPYIENSLDVLYKGASPYPYLDLDYDDSDDDQYRTLSLSSSWDYSFDSTAKVNMTGSWYLKEYYLDSLESSNKDNLKYSLTYTKKWTGSDLSVKWNDAKIYSGSITSYNFKPDVIYQIPALKLPLLSDVNVKLNYTELEKYTYSDDVATIVEGRRLGVDTTKSWKIWQKDNLTLTQEDRIYWRQFTIDEEDSELNAFQAGLNLKAQLTKRLSSSLEMGYDEVEGVSNSFFRKGDSSLQAGAYLINTWAWKDSKFNASFKNYYYFLKETGTASLNTQWKPSSKFNFVFNTNYDLEDGFGYTTLAGDLNWNDGIKSAVNLIYDFESLTWSTKQFELKVNQKLGAKWQVEAATRYSLVQDDFSIANATLTYNGHCRKLKFYYDWTDREFWFQIIFKAFPQATIKLDQNMELLNYDDWLE